MMDFLGFLFASYILYLDLENATSPETSLGRVRKKKDTTKKPSLSSQRIKTETAKQKRNFKKLL